MLLDVARVGNVERVVGRVGWPYRNALAREMTRVLVPGGKIVVSSPNRHFPLDIFHGRKPGSYKPRLNLPGNRFLLSVGDYFKLFREAGCSSAEPQPINGYWGFTRSQHAVKGYLLGLPVMLVFWIVSIRWLKFLYPSPLAPWIVVVVSKKRYYEKRLGSTGE